MINFRQTAYWWQGAIAASILLFPHVAAAQITPDSSVGTTVTPNVEIKGVRSEVIDGGTIRGANLFHSFSEFNIETGRGAYFTNPEGITNIFSRITGNNLSNINGILGVLGNANLFLLNPNGIIFGANAKLDLNGSFLGTTANSIRFADGIEFSATNAATSPLLTISVPIGLQMGTNPGAITIRGNGHQIKIANLFSPFTRNDTGGLQVSPGNTLALVGGDITLTGGTLTAPSGRIELGAVENGLVTLNPTASGLTLDYSRISSFRNLQLLQTALADVSGAPSGSVQLQGRQVTLRDGSAVWSQNRGSTQGGNIEVRGSESIELNGFTPGGNPTPASSQPADVTSALFLEATGSGTVGDIRVSAPQIRILNGGTIQQRNFSPSPAGSLQVHATESIQMDGFWIDNRASFLASGTYGDGLGADVVISTPQLNLLNGADISAFTMGKGNGGNVTIHTDRAIVDGTTANRQNVSRISVVTFGAGNAGNFTLNTRTLTIGNSGEIGTASISSGNAGLFVVNATESVVVTGGLVGAFNPSQIRSAVIAPSPSFQRIFGVDAVPKGNAGGVTINTPSLTVADGARINVRNEGIGNGGILKIDADSILLDNGGSLTATTNLGEGGDIAVSSAMLVMRRGSSITSTAAGTVGSGGNITIDSPTIIGLENSDIIANAVRGNGGNIQINTQGIFGLQYRPQQTEDSDITASSQFGLSGTVAISNPEVDARSFLVQLPENLVDASQQITSGCELSRGNTFTVSGRGGLPEDPTSSLLGRAIWWDDRDLSEAHQTADLTQQRLHQTETNPIVEATSWKINPQGQVELVADVSSSNAWASPTSCQTLQRQLVRDRYP